MSTRIAATIAVLVACGPAIPPVPSKGGPAWRELTSEHFTLWTNSSRERGHELIREMEDLRQAVVGIAFRGARGSGRSFVIALRDEDEVRAFMPGDFAAMATQGNSYLEQPMIVLAADPDTEWGPEITAHELTHTISQAVIRDQPRWFGEGLAKYFETIVIDRKRQLVELGRAPTHRGQPIRMQRLITLERMFACKDLTCVDASFYVTAWALFTYLTNQRAAELARYEQLLVERPGDHDGAWREAFAQIPLHKLDHDMQQWLATGSHTILKFNIALRQWPVSERMLVDADVYAARALLRLQFQERTEDARQLANAALALDPQHRIAGLVLRNCPAP